MIRVQINQEEQRELERYRRQSSSRNSEKALMVLMNAGGDSAEAIAKKLQRNPHTVRMWLKRYLAGGIRGLERRFPPGRPPDKREQSKSVIEGILAKSPQEAGYPDLVWSIPLICHHLQVAYGIQVSEDTVIRGLKSLGYTYKRPCKTVPPQAPSVQEKRAAIEEMIRAIEKLLRERECEVLILDESHFSTEPYLVRGWFKKRWPPSDSRFQKKRKLHHIWLLKFEERAFLLEAIRAG